jgi:hypothetical protein
MDAGGDSTLMQRYTVYTRWLDVRLTPDLPFTTRGGRLR